MTREPLTNDRWGFASQCFVCEAKNPTGLRIPFFHDTEAGLVVADFTLTEAFSGAPNYVHGGVVLAILDEAMAWATIALLAKFAVTTRTTTTFARPIRVGAEHRVEASVTDNDEGAIATEARIFDVQGRLCATANATFAALDLRQATSAIGSTVTGADASFVEG